MTLPICTDHVYQDATYADCGFGNAELDDVLTFLEGQGLVVWDFGSEVGWPLGVDPTGGDVVPNLAGGANGVWTLAGGVDYAGGGMDFSACSANGNLVSFPGAVADIQAAAAEEWLVIAWVKLPVSGDWPDASTARDLLSFGKSTTGAALVDIYLATAGAVKNLVAKRQTAVNTLETVLVIAPNASSFGAIAQIAVWRVGGKTYGRLRTPAENTIYNAAGVTGADNSADMTACALQFGILSNTASPWTASFTSNDSKVSNHRHLRGLVANLHGLEIDVIALLDQDYANTLARGDYT